jgi:EAL domain-containing protein (putative c-di-GMP-specific phosphodiesterase class I)
MDAAIARMKSLRALGCRFALDDFGSGFASYAYLKQLPVDDVKIDGSFIRNLDHNAEDRIFVTAAAEMAHAMGKKVIAEFVESEAILDVLIELGIDFGQGYFIGRPVPELPAPEDARPAPQPLPH